MPTTDSFGLTLVDAVTREPLKEYHDGSTGTTWVKGEPGDEFFVVVKCEVRDDVKCKIAIDGKDLGYNWVSHAPDTSPFLGPLKSGQTISSGDDDHLTTHALRFVRHEVSRDAESTETHSISGSVTASWYTAECDARSECSWKMDDWTPEETRVTSGHAKDSSVLRTVAGSMPGSLNTSVHTHFWRGVDRLRTLEIKYTTDFGLAVRGLLSDEETRPVKDETPKRRKTDVGYRVHVDASGKEIIELD